MRERASVQVQDKCCSCQYFLDDPTQLERELPGLTILSSAWGSTRGNAGLCSRYATWQDPVRECPAFKARVARVFPERAACVTER